MTKIGFNFYTLLTDLLFAKRVSEKLTNDTKLISNSCASAWSLSKSLPGIVKVKIPLLLLSSIKSSQVIYFENLKRSHHHDSPHIKFV